jgi:chromosome segregation ATPase
MSEDFTQKLPKNGSEEILTAITRIDDRLQSLERKVEEKLYDTRPIWHKVIADIAELQSGQKRLEEGQKHLDEGQQSLRVSITQLHSSVRDVSRDQIVINDVIRRLQMDFHNIDEKLYKLTVNRNQPNSQT